MAGVFRVWDLRLRVWRAAKVLYPQFASRQSVRLRFAAEAHAMARLEHENLVRVYDVEDQGPLPFLVMELVQGGTLHDWVRQYGPMGPQLACSAISQVAAGAYAAHQAGIVHRDIKPQNVLISPQGTCKLTDFGVASQTDHGLTRPGVALGTAGYMAPEQRVDASSADQRADVYALGATLWTLLTGELAHELHHVGQKPRLLQMIPEPLQPFIQTACALEPADRYPDVRYLHHALVEAVQRLPADPADGVPLTAPVQLEQEDEPDHTFPEIQPVLEGAGALPERPSSPGPTPVPGERADAPKVLPYTMPSVQGQATPIRMWDRVDDEVPEYVDREAMAKTPPPVRGALVRTPGGEVVTTSGTTPDPSPRVPTPVGTAPERQPRPKPPKRKKSKPRPVRQEEPPSGLHTMQSLLVVVGIGSLAALLMVLVLAMGGARLGAARRASIESRARIYDALQDVGNTIPEFPLEEQPELQDAYVRYLEEADEPDRFEAAMACLRALEEATPATVAGERPPVTLQTVRRLRALRLDYENDYALWVRRSQSFPGSLLVAVGVAQGPSDR